MKKVLWIFIVFLITISAFSCCTNVEAKHTMTQMGDGGNSSSLAVDRLDQGDWKVEIGNQSVLFSKKYDSHDSVNQTIDISDKVIGIGEEVNVNFTYAGTNNIKTVTHEISGGIVAATHNYDQGYATMNAKIIKQEGLSYAKLNITMDQGKKFVLIIKFSSSSLAVDRLDQGDWKVEIANQSVLFSKKYDSHDSANQTIDISDKVIGIGEEVNVNFIYAGTNNIKTVTHEISGGTVTASHTYYEGYAAMNATIAKQGELKQVKLIITMDQGKKFVLIIKFSVIFDDVLTNLDKYIPDNSDAHSEKFTNKVSIILSFITNIGIIISVIISAVLGVKYMLGSAEEKAEYKHDLIPYILGSCLLFGICTVVKILQSVGESMNNI